MEVPAEIELAVCVELFVASFSRVFGMFSFSKISESRAMILSLRAAMQRWAAWPSRALLSSSQRERALGMAVDSRPSSRELDCGAAAVVEV